jgi:hypothetical protein
MNERTNPSDDQVRELMQRYNFRYPIVSDLADLIRDAWREGQRTDSTKRCQTGSDAT